MNLEAITIFYAGMLVQAVYLLLGRFERRDVGILLACCGASLLGLWPGKHERAYDLPLHLFLVPCVFSAAYAVFFKKRLLERINKVILMVWTLIFLYVSFQTSWIINRPYLSIPLVILSLVPVVNAFLNIDRSYFWKVCFYIWFLCVLVGIGASQFAFSTVAAVFSHNGTTADTWASFFVGMSFLYLAVNAWYVIELIPLPGKHQPLKERLMEVKKDMNILAADYDEEEVCLWKTMAISILSALLLGINYACHVVDDMILVPILIAALPVIDKVFSGLRPATPDGKTALERHRFAQPAHFKADPARTAGRRPPANGTPPGQR